MSEQEPKPDTKNEKAKEKSGAHKIPEQLRTERIGEIKQQLDRYEGPRSDHELELRTKEIMQQYGCAIEGVELSDETKKQLDDKMKEEIAGIQKRMARYQERRQEWQLLSAQELILTMSGEIYLNDKPYKLFNSKKYERFLIQKGEFRGSDVVFKVAESKDRDTIQNESRNLHVIEDAPVEQGIELDVHFVRQVGDVFENNEMVGLMTEYIQNDPELKRELSAEQKVEIIGRTIENLQRLSVTNEARESGLPTHDGEKIARDAQHFLSTLLKEGRIDAETANALQATFRNALPSLAAERPVFVHGDTHGDNIFVRQTDAGELDVSLLDFEGLRISNKYHDWSDILNKSAFLKHIQANRPGLLKPIRNNIENMWLDESVAFDEQAIIDKISKGDPDKAKNFHLTRTYDKLTRIMNDRNATLPIAQERAILYLGQLRDDAQKFG